MPRPFVHHQRTQSGGTSADRRRRWKLLLLAAAPCAALLFFFRSAPAPLAPVEAADDAPGGEFGEEGPPLTELSSPEDREDGAPDPHYFDTRQRLNSLVATSAAKTMQQRCNIGFIKTHKTGSTTLTSILYRYGARHNKTLSRFDVRGTSCTLDKAVEDVARGKGMRPEIWYYHYVWDGWFKGGEFDTIENKYNKFMSKHAPVDFVTVLRDPVGHYLSFYYFYMHPTNHIRIEEYLKKPRIIKNPLCAEFGIYGPKQLDRFIAEFLPKFALIMLTERFDEGVVLMTKLFGWDLIDATYSSMLENKDGAVRWDGKPLARAPKMTSLSAESQKRLKDAVSLDQKLYDAAKVHYEAVRARHIDTLQSDMEKFLALQESVQKLLTADKTLMARTWYNPDADLLFYKTPDLQTGKAPPIPF